MPVLLEKSICVMPAPVSRPRPVKTAVSPPVATTTTLRVPSVAERFSTICAAVPMSPGVASQLPAGLTRLTTQASELVESAQPAVRSLTNWKRTGWLRRIASARAVLSPCITVCAAFLICWFCRKMVNAGTATNSTIATIAKPIISSMMVMPRAAAGLRRIRALVSTTRLSSKPSRWSSRSSRAGW